MKAKPRRVDWNNTEDVQCAILGSLGMSTKCISDKTGLSPCQVTYRLGRANIRRVDYRNGDSYVAKRVMKYALPQSLDETRRILRLK
jgi:hypothetical protein